MGLVPSGPGRPIGDRHFLEIQGRFKKAVIVAPRIYQYHIGTVIHDIAVIVLAGGLKTLELLQTDTPAPWQNLILGTALSAVSAYACIHFFLKVLDRVSLTAEEFYGMLQTSDEAPLTSQPPPTDSPSRLSSLPSIR